MHRFIETGVHPQLCRTSSARTNTHTWSHAVGFTRPGRGADGGTTWKPCIQREQEGEWVVVVGTNGPQMERCGRGKVQRLPRAELLHCAAKYRARSELRTRLSVRVTWPFLLRHQPMRAAQSRWAGQCLDTAAICPDPQVMKFRANNELIYSSWVLLMTDLNPPPEQMPNYHKFADLS